MVKLMLESEGSNLLIETELNGWSRCTLILPSEQVYLGATTARNLLVGLLEVALCPEPDLLTIKTASYLGEPVITALFLSEIHYVLVVSQKAPPRTLLWMKNLASEDHMDLAYTMSLTPTVSERWCVQLEAMRHDLIEAGIKVS